MNLNTVSQLSKAFTIFSVAGSLAISIEAQAPWALNTSESVAPQNGYPPFSAVDDPDVSPLLDTTSINYTLMTRVSPRDGGTITCDPSWRSYPSGWVVTLTATPANHGIFSGWSGSIMGSSRTIKITMDGNKIVRASFVAPSNCGTPPFDPTPWNDGASVQRHNNCYNYANNVKTNTFAQPGAYCGNEASTSDCADVIAAAKCDGLVPTTKDAVLPPGMTRIALAVDDGFDYHWYRQDNDGMWSHKPGGCEARNTDESGKLIDSPETCNRGDYTVFCLYFQICSGVEQFGGHSTIK